MKTHQDAVKSLKELQEFAVQRNDSDMLGVITQAKVSVESQAAKRVNCVQKTLFDYWKKYRKSENFNFSMFSVMFDVFSDYTVNKLTSMVFYFVSNTCMSWFNFYM